MGNENFLVYLFSPLYSNKLIKQFSESVENKYMFVKPQGHSAVCYLLGI